MGTQIIKRIDLDWQSSFPHAKMLVNQEASFNHIAESGLTALIEAPTGSGKTATGYTFLSAIALRARKSPQFKGRLVYVAPNKALVGQVQNMHPDVKVALGRNEHTCSYYDGIHQADEVPCSFLVRSGRCGHYVNQETGATLEFGAEPCSYYQQIYEAKRGIGILACTDAFWLFTHLFNPKQWPQPMGLVLDEVDRLADIVRRCLSYEISDWRIERAINLLEKVGSVQVQYLSSFLRTLNRVVSKKPALEPILLDDEEIRQLFEKVGRISADVIKSDLDAAIASNKVDPMAEREILKQIETLCFDISRYVRSLGYALPNRRGKGDERKRDAPLSYAYAYHKSERDAGAHVQNKVVVCSYWVRPLIRKLFGKNTLAYSAFVGDKTILDYEAGVDFPLISLRSQFPASNARLYVPSDSPNLAYNEQDVGDMAKTLRHIAISTRRFAERGFRSLLLTVSNRERELLYVACAELKGLDAISYGSGVTARAAADRFKEGEGDALIGVLSHYGTGLDLPGKIANIVFLLRPNFPPPKDPMAQFEIRRAERIKKSHWPVWYWRAYREALNAQGRPIRSADDKGVAFFISQQFKKRLFNILPEHLESAYRSRLTWDQCEKDALKLFEE
ncbi:hypothetical protein BK004_03495 [bacterium CG10_46_32]|nr:MAG: hypothetical protein BK004_03495 [bacterium CG10_46_32]PIR55936.1 MAG: hypothetical protein COU73_03535 [Parcubacteria group bacterium CG10_big_fil_rev_8_21_14_0_10_46_32]